MDIERWSQHIFEKKQTHRYRKESCGCQGESEGKIGSFGIAEANYST